MYKSNKEFGIPYVDPIRHFPGATQIFRPRDLPQDSNDPRLVLSVRPHGEYSLDNPLMLGYGEHGEPDCLDYFIYNDFDEE